MGWVISQAGIINIAGGGGGGSPVQTLTGDDSIAVPPTANNIFVIGGNLDTNNVNGIETTGNAGTSTLTVNLTNRITGTVTTADAVPTVYITFALGATPGTYLFHFSNVAYNLTDLLSAGYDDIITVRTTGAAGSIIVPRDFVTEEEGAMSAADLDYSISGNSLQVTATGIAGKVIHWLTSGTYIFVS